MPTTSIPRPDGDFGAFSNHSYEAVEKWWNVLGLDLNDLTDLKKALDTWKAMFPAHIAAQAGAEGEWQNRDAARVELERQVRPIANFIQTYPATTDADRAAIGITVKQPTGGASPEPPSRPVVRLDTGLRLRHTIRFTDEAVPTRRARPKNTRGAVGPWSEMCSATVAG